jgi:gas vesicle protein
MPARRRKQSNAMLYTLITFVGLFIATTTIAVIYYVKAEEYKTREADLQRDINFLATDRERQALGTIVGTKQPGKTWLSTMVDYHDRTVSMVVGGVPESTSAEVKVNNGNTEVTNVQKLAQEHITIGDPNLTGLVQIVQGLKTELDKTIKEKLEVQKQLEDTETRFQNADKANFEKEQTLLAEKDKLQQQVDDIEQKYTELSALLEQTTGEQVQTLRDQLQQVRDDLKALNDQLLKTQEELKLAQNDLKSEKEKLSKIEPGPDREILAYDPDGQIILIDDQAKVVHLNIGIDDHVYQGLRFTVYDRGTSVPEDGKGKAEIEVFDVAKTYSAARITKSELRKPILEGDIVANLIWESDRTNVFVIAGDFDLDNDGMIDYNGEEKIKTLIEKWGGKVADSIAIDTDFLVLGKQPQVLQKPTLDEQDIDPRAMEVYNASLQRLNRYNGLRDQAQTLWIPVFTYDRFLYFIGYKGHIGQAGAF